MAPGQAPEKRMASLRESLTFLSQIEDVLQRNIFLKRMSERLGIDQDLLKAELNKVDPARKPTEGIRPAGKKKEFDPIELGLIRMLLNKPALVRSAVEKSIFTFFLDEELKQFGNLLANEEITEASGLIGRIENADLQKQLWKLMVLESPYENGSLERIFTDTVKKIKTKWFRQKHEILKIELRKAEERNDQRTCSSILLEKEKLKKEEKAL
jgi:DNA primase